MKNANTSRTFIANSNGIPQRWKIVRVGKELVYTVCPKTKQKRKYTQRAFTWLVTEKKILLEK